MDLNNLLTAIMLESRYHAYYHLVPYYRRMGRREWLRKLSPCDRSMLGWGPSQASPKPSNPPIIIHLSVGQYRYLKGIAEYRHCSLNQLIKDGIKYAYGDSTLPLVR